MEGTREYQVGLEGLGSLGENWGLELPESNLLDDYQATRS